MKEAVVAPLAGLPLAVLGALRPTICPGGESTTDRLSRRPASSLRQPSTKERRPLAGPCQAALPEFWCRPEPNPHQKEDASLAHGRGKEEGRSPDAQAERPVPSVRPQA